MSVNAVINDLQAAYDQGPLVTGGRIVLDPTIGTVAIEDQTASSGTIVVANEIDRSGVLAANDGVAQQYSLGNDAGTLLSAFQVGVEWSDASAGSEDTEIVFSTRQLGLFAESLRLRASGIDTQIVSPFAFVLSPDNDTANGLEITTTAGDTFVIPRNPANAFYLGNTEADPSIDTDRGTARALSIVPLGTTLTSAGAGEWINFGADITIDYAGGSSIGGLVSATNTFTFQNFAASAFGAGNLFKNAATFTSTDVSIGSQYTFVNTAVYRSDGFAMSNFFHRICLFQTQWTAINGGTQAITTVNQGGLLNPTIGAGVTVTNMRDWEWSAGTFTGTVTNRDHLYFPATNTPAATIFSAIRSLIAASANHLFINHTGTAESVINGTINMTGSALLNFSTADALGGGAAATLGTIGGTGPTAAAQSTWIRVERGGTTHWIPAWV